MKIIIGLGNPGEKYKSTRHNAGFEVIDILADSLGLNWQEDKKRKALVARDNKYTLIKPMSYMNLSGEPTRAILDYYKILPKNFKLFTIKNSDLSGILTVVHDDLDIDFGVYKKSTDSRSAGNNGVQSIINNLGTKNFNRYRIGIKNDSLRLIPSEKFVLQRFNKEEKEVLASLYRDIVKDLQN
ncbi:MAG: aminoacyl-tRNA hydrolase [Patescibacteria group bacterium]|jgi:PTH1 family peptidyl-tRNA hydrolase|nr:aminoacyl-tRNA hydrolase [Patescibacteria group bacterium]